MNHGAKLGPIWPPNCPGVTTPPWFMLTSRCGKTTPEGSPLLRSWTIRPATAVTAGQSLGCGRLGRYPGGNWLRPVSMIVWASLCSLDQWVRERRRVNR